MRFEVDNSDTFASECAKCPFVNDVRRAVQKVELRVERGAECSGAEDRGGWG